MLDSIDNLVEQKNSQSSSQDSSEIHNLPIETRILLYLEEGDKCWQAGELDKTIASYLQAIELDPLNPKAHQKLAIAFKHQGNLQEASRHYRQAVILNTEKIDSDTQEAQLPFPNNLDYETANNTERVVHPTLLLSSNSTSLVDRPSNSFSFQPLQSIDRGNLVVAEKETESLVPRFAKLSIHEAEIASTSSQSPQQDLCQRKSGSEAAQIYLHQALAYCDEQQWDRAIASCQNALHLTPQTAEAYKIWGNVLQKMGKTAEAMGYYAKAVEIQPNLAEVYANIGSLYAQKQNWQSAIEYYQKAIVINPRFAGAYRNLAKVCQKLGDTEKASEYNYRALQLEPEKISAEEHFRLGQEMLEQGKFVEASTHYQYSIKLKPDFLLSYQKLAETLEQIGQWKEATQYYRQLLKLKECERLSNEVAETINENSEQKQLSPVQSLPQLQQANNSQLLLNPSLPESPNLESANITQKIKLYQQKAAQKPDSSVIQANLGALYAQQKQWQKAIACYQKAIQLDANFAGAYRNLGKILTQIGQKERAANCWYKAFRLEPNQFKAEEHLYLANTLFGQKKVDKAIVCYRQAIQIQPNLAEAYWRLGEIIDDRGQKQEAINYYRQAISHNRNLPHCYYRLAEALATCQEWDEAIFCYRQAIVLEPNYVQAYHNLGDIFSQQMHWEQAVDAYSRAIELNPDFSWSHNNLADVFLKQGQWREAIYAYRRAIKLNPDFVWSYYNLAEALVELEDWEGAIEGYQKALEIKPDLFAAEEKLNYLVNRRSMSDLEFAFQCYLKAIEQDPTDIDSYRKALEIKPEDPELYIGLANALVARGEL